MMWPGGATRHCTAYVGCHEAAVVLLSAPCPSYAYHQLGGVFTTLQQLLHPAHPKSHQLLDLSQPLEAWRVDAQAFTRPGDGVARRGSHSSIKACQLTPHLLLQRGTRSGCREQQIKVCRHHRARGSSRYESNDVWV
jgi:hypothetical protein